MNTRSPEWERLKEENQNKRLEFARKLTTEEKQSLARNWVDNYVLKLSTNDPNQTDREVSACLFDSSIGLEVIELIWRLGMEKQHYSYLGVVVEDFLSIHGEEVVGQFESLVSKEPSFRNVLKFVYCNTMPKKVYLRISALAGGGYA